MDKVALKEAEIDQAAMLLQGPPRKKMTNADKANAHHSSDVKNWSAFEENLSNKGFQKAVMKHELSDDKLKAYVQNYGAYLTAKKTVGTVPSRTGPQSYTIKKLPSGRLGCDCKDWQYKHSWKGTDCDHIQMLQGTTKTSAVAKYLRGLQTANRAWVTSDQGHLAKQYSDAMQDKKSPLLNLDLVKKKFL